MKRLLLDTVSLIWFKQQNKRLGRRSLTLIDAALAEGECYISALSFWEIHLLQLKQRIKLDKPLQLCREEWLEQGLQELHVSSRAVQYAMEIPPFHTDPTDCLIMGTAMAQDAVLVTSDTHILAWKGHMLRQDATL